MKVLFLLPLLATSGFCGVSESLNRAYDALKSGDYDQAIPSFLQAVAEAPTRPEIRKDLAYTYLKAGDTEAARDQFGEAMRLDPQDTHVALEYAFLCYESRNDGIVWKAVARRIFDRLRKSGSAEAERAFQNIDRPLAEGIERWTQALRVGTDNYSVHYELAQLAEQRDELELASIHYLKAWRLQPSNKAVLVDLGRALTQAGRVEEAHAALLAASRGGETRASEQAREVLPERYPYVYEFRRAIELDPDNGGLHRELGYLLLKMSEAVDGDERRQRQKEAEEEFRIIVAAAPKDLLSCAQLGFLYLGRKDLDHAMPLLKRVMEGEDRDLANRVRLSLHLEPEMEKRAAVEETQVDARVMAEKSYAAGYMRDALRYLTLAHQEDPEDYSVILKLGYAENMLHDDASALVWFSLARNSPDLSIARQARRAFANLRPNFSRVRTTVWLSPFYSTRWDDNFAYGQIKTELRLPGLPVHPYLSMRFVGDTRQYLPGSVPVNLSESSFIFGAGVSSNPWHGMSFWGEAGTAVSYLGAARQKDLRGGLAWGKLWGHSLFSESAGAFFESSADGVFVSRFGNDSLAILQTKAGYTLPALGPLRSQVFLHGNATQDVLRQYWANFLEAGPGLRLHLNGTPPSLLFSVSVLRGAYTANAYNPRRPNFFDVRAGFWYAFTR